MAKDIQKTKKVAASNIASNNISNAIKEEIHKTEEKNVDEVNLKIKTSVFRDLEGAFLLINVGTPDKPADNSDLQDIASTITGLFEENNINCIAYVTHHAVTMRVIR